MEKLDAALNNMSHGLCMFVPNNRLLLWNDRYDDAQPRQPRRPTRRRPHRQCFVPADQNGCWVMTHEDITERGRFRHRLFVAVLPAGSSVRQDQIDQTFISRIGDSFQAGAIIHAILRLGRTLALPVIAEGVETEEQRAFLAREGCQVQGYLIGRPEPIAHYRHLVVGFAGTHENIAGVR